MFGRIGSFGMFGVRRVWGLGRLESFGDVKSFGDVGTGRVILFLKISLSNSPIRNKICAI